MRYWALSNETSFGVVSKDECLAVPAFCLTAVDQAVVGNTPCWVFLTNTRAQLMSFHPHLTLRPVHVLHGCRRTRG